MEYYDQISKKMDQNTLFILLIYYIDLVLRIFLILAGIGFSFSFAYQSSTKAIGILMQLCKISQINISFYSAHYNKMGIYFKSNNHFADTFPEI